LTILPVRTSSPVQMISMRIGQPNTFTRASTTSPGFSRGMK